MHKPLHNASKTNISELNLKEKSKFEYLFDFGDDWLHEITVEKILDIYPNKGYPEIVTKKGESPPQYPDHEAEEEYEQWEIKNDKIRKENNQILTEFSNYLASKKLSTKTIEKHISNIDFFINEFLLHNDLLRPWEGIGQINYFLGFWFIRKAMRVQLPLLMAISQASNIFILLW